MTSIIVNPGKSTFNNPSIIIKIIAGTFLKKEHGNTGCYQFGQFILRFLSAVLNLVHSFVKINKESDVAIFLVEQNTTQALQIADRGYVMENGLIVTEDKASNLLNDEVVKKVYLGIA